MSLTVRHRPADPDRNYFLHAWMDEVQPWDLAGVTEGDYVRFDIAIADVDLRRLQFKYRSQDANSLYWEADDFIRRIHRVSADAIWTFESSALCKFEDPGPATTLAAVTIHAVTQSRFSGGAIYCWNPYDSTNPSEEFEQSGRDDAAGVSDFVVSIRPWMVGGFNFKLVGPPGNNRLWEPDRSNRVWCPSDGKEIWIKSGQLVLRQTPLQLIDAPVQVFYPASMGPPPTVKLMDGVDDYDAILQAQTDAPSASDPLYRVASYPAQTYAEAVYLLSLRPNSAGAAAESPILHRPFPVDPTDPTTPSLALLGADDWLDAEPARSRLVEIRMVVDSIDSLGTAPTARLGVGRAVPYSLSTSLVAQPDGTWAGTFAAFPDRTQWLAILPSGGAAETRPDGPAAVRTFTPATGGPTIYRTAEAVFGLTSSGPVNWGDVSTAQRQALMKVAFTPAIVDAGTFDSWEMPQGTTVVPAGTAGLADGTWFVLFGPQAAAAAVLLLDRQAALGATVTRVAMQLTDDLRYWWCLIPTAQAGHGKEYRFALNDDIEVLDPAARWATDTGTLVAKKDEGLSPDDSKRGPWSRVVDSARLRAVQAGSSYGTPSWESLLIYEMHPHRFTDRNVDSTGTPLIAFDQVVAELKVGSYLKNLGVTTLEFLPVHEFPSDNSWGYNPALYFAVDSSYGGPEAFARAVRAAHDAGKAVMLDLVYNHLDDSPLQVVGPVAYVDGATQWGPMVNFDHPAAMEHFRQATVYFADVFAVDGYRFDSTETMVNSDHWTDSTPYVIGQGPDGEYLFGSGHGWEFLGYLRTAVRRAADAIGRGWPYLCGENEPNNWPMTFPGNNVLDGQWNFTLSGALGGIAWNAPDSDNAGGVKSGMDADQTWLGRYFESVRYGESHDTASGQNNGANKRIAARPVAGNQGWQMAKAVGAVALLANGIPMLFMGEEGGETIPFYFDNLKDAILNPQRYVTANDGQTVVLAWFQSLMGLRNDPSNSMGGDDRQAVCVGRKTVAFTRGWDGRFFIVATFGTPDNRQDTSWLGMLAGAAYKEIFNSSWPVFQVEAEQEQANGGYDAVISAGNVVNLPTVGAVVFERR